MALALCLWDHLFVLFLGFSVLDHIHYSPTDDPEGHSNHNTLDKIIWKNDQPKYHAQCETNDYANTNI